VAVRKSGHSTSELTGYGGFERRDVHPPASPVKQWYLGRTTC